jgi:hypothetical protein
MVFWLLKSFDQLPKSVISFLAVDQIFWSTEKCQKFWSTDYENFDQLIKHNFDQVNFGQTTPCLKNNIASLIIGGGSFEKISVQALNKTKIHSEEDYLHYLQQLSCICFFADNASSEWYVQSNLT